MCSIQQVYGFFYTKYMQTEWQSLGATPELPACPKAGEGGKKQNTTSLSSVGIAQSLLLDSLKAPGFLASRDAATLSF